jgi:hypothetical protein
MRELSFHIFQVPDVFVRNVAGEFEDWAHYVNLPVPDNVETKDHILDFAQEASGSLANWWDRLEDRDCHWTVKTYYGPTSGWALLERQAWHSAQHVRQLQAVLDGCAVVHTQTVSTDLYEGLPMPVGLWE